jgi:hypothetical protein
MNRSHKLITVWVLALTAATPLAAQATFEIPKPGTTDPSVFRPQPPPEAPKDEAAEKAAALVYQGEPLKLPLECRAEAFLRAGLVCSEEAPCDMLLELVDITQVQERVLLIGNIHTPSATIATVLLRSDDGGKTWTEPFERVDAAGLEMVQTLDAQHGWIGGQQTTQDHASSPFLLVTTDGGLNWVRRPIWSGDEDRHGAVIEIYFDEPQHGFVIIDRLTSEGDSYELYESMNSGLSWSIREISSEMPTIRRRLVPNEQEKPWRLNEDRGAAAYEVERLVDGEWSKVSAFAGDLGPCRSVAAEKPFHVGREP